MDELRIACGTAGLIGLWLLVDGGETMREGAALLISALAVYVVER